jgi:protein-S-isoprenylcysteine O-methyltransferase Ste14
MSATDPYLVIRAAALYLPVVIGAIACLIKRPDPRQLTGAFMALAWNLPFLLALHVIALALGWWRFDAEGGLLFGMPIDLWLGWALLWGPVAYIAFPRTSLPIVVAIALLIDVWVMPAAAPLVELGDRWIVGEFVALTSCLIPAQLLARWTAADRYLSARATLQVIAFSVLVVWLLPAIAISASGTEWRIPITWPHWIPGIVVQLLAVPAILGLSAVQEFVTRGGGTPIPFDPPRRIVTSGPYAYVANPMQLSAAVVLIAIGAIVANVWVALAGAMSIVYSAGLAYWDEDQDLRRRFGDAWMVYRSKVPIWLPRARPWYRDDSPTAILYVSDECEMCREVASWYRSRSVRGLAIVPAEDHPRETLTRIRYESAEGGYRASGIDAVGRALEHIHLGWAFAGFAIRLPIVSSLVQVIVDASGGQPRPVARRAERII